MSTPPPPPPPGSSDWSGYGQAAYNQPYGQPGYGYRPPQDHPKATTAMVLGILGLAVCGILGPFALVMGRRAVKEIDASCGTLGGRGQATAGWVCGLIATILLGVGLLFFAFWLLLVIVSVSTSNDVNAVLLR